MGSRLNWLQIKGWVLLASGWALACPHDVLANTTKHQSTAQSRAASQSTAALALVGTYRLTRFGGRPVRDVDLAKAQISFQPDGRVYAGVGCNQISAILQVQAAPGRILSFGQSLSTLIGCTGGLGRAESQILQLLRDTANIARAGNHLTFFNTTGTPIAAWTTNSNEQASSTANRPPPASPPVQQPAQLSELTQGEYVLVELNGTPIASPAAQSVQAPNGVPRAKRGPPQTMPRNARIVPSVPSLILLENGEVSGSGGCNRYNTTLVSDQTAAKRFGPIASSKRACSDRVVGSLENDLFAVLRNATRVAIANGRFDVFDTSNTPTARFATISARATAGSALYDTTWVLKRFNQAAIPQSSPPTIKFESNRVSGTTGCNQYGFDYVRQPGRSRFANGVSTQMGCEAARMSLESRFLQAMSTISNVSVAINRLTLRSVDGRTVLEFEAE